MTSFRILYFFAINFIISLATAQTGLSENQQKIANSISDYFRLDRENIHLHLNKTTYLTNEQIWFKGYIIEKKHKPTLNTSNIFISLIDSSGQKIATQLYYAEGNLFEGRMKLNKTMHSGKYYLQVYTNFMNNFSEDESSVYEISILNLYDKNHNSTPAPGQSASINFYPESGVFLEGASNTIGVKISDCLDNGISVQNAGIFDAKGNLVTTFSTDQFGYGKFEIYSVKAENYKAVATFNGTKIQASLPLPSASGIAFCIDNYIFPEKTVIKIRTNAKTLENIKNKPYSLVFQQHENTIFAEFSLAENQIEHKFIVSSSQFNEGINSVFLLDENSKKVAERLIYKPMSTPNVASVKTETIKSDSIRISGNSKVPFGNFSISVVPSQTEAENNLKTIQDRLVFDNYLIKPASHSFYYLTDFTRKKHYELDNFLLAQRPKYDWNAISGNAAPFVKFESDAGLSVKGTVNTDDSKGKIFKINMNSIGLGLNEFTSLNDRNEFVFEHLLGIDSTKIYFVAKDKAGKNLDHKIVYQIQNNTRKFLKSFSASEPFCGENVISEKKPILLPRFDNAILLDSINVLSKKNRLVNQNRLGNVMAKAFKISDQDRNSGMDLLRFIGKNGYTVSTIRGEIRIEGAFDNSSYKNQGPEIFIDDMPIPSYDILFGYSLDQVDEIYINRHNNGPRTSGIIKIYTKKNYGIFNNNISSKSPLLILKNGFQRYQPYQNPKYDSMQDEGFKTLGTIDWKPFVPTDENGNFTFTIPNFYQKSIKIIIEGMSANGEMISEIKTLNIP